MSTSATYARAGQHTPSPELSGIGTGDGPEDVLARIFWDTNLFIYLFENKPRHTEAVVRLRRRMLARGDQLYTSALTIGEVLVQPIRASQTDLVERYQTFFRTPSITIISLDPLAASLYAKIRQDRRIQPPDAIQLACAAAADIDLFLTNDDRLSRKVISGIRFITSLDHAPL